MARALARGWHRPVLCTDVFADRAEALALEVGGEELASNAEVAERAEPVVLCHKPAQLEGAAAEVRHGLVGGAPAPGVDPDLVRRVRELFGELGLLMELPEALIDVAMAL